MKELSPPLVKPPGLPNVGRAGPHARHTSGRPARYLCRLPPIPEDAPVPAPSVGLTDDASSKAAPAPFPALTALAAAALRVFDPAQRRDHPPTPAAATQILSGAQSFGVADARGLHPWARGHADLTAACEPVLKESEDPDHRRNEVAVPSAPARSAATSAACSIPIR
jgi:hypothetical protein